MTMKTNIEIEFKTLIDENTYLKMLKLFNLENNVFEQINHYFDTDKLFILIQIDHVFVRNGGGIDRNI